METVLLERYIKEVLKEEEYLELPDFTWKDLREFVKNVKEQKKSEKNKKRAKNITEKGVGLALSLLGVSDVLKIGQFAAEGLEIGLAYVLSKLYDINGKSKVKDNPFKIDPGVSKLIDDKVEERFIYYLADKLTNTSEYPDNKTIDDNFDMTTELQKFLKDSKGGAAIYGGANVTK